MVTLQPNVLSNCCVEYFSRSTLEAAVIDALTCGTHGIFCLLVPFLSAVSCPYSVLDKESLYSDHVMLNVT